MNKQTKQPDTCTLCGSMSLRLLQDRSTHDPILSPDGMKIYRCEKCKCMSNEYELTTPATGTLGESAPVNFKQFQATRKKVTAPYGYMDDITDDIETAFTYMGTFERFIEESAHIRIWTNEELIKKHGGKYWLILDRSEYNSNDLGQLEKMLFKWIQEN